MRQISTTLFFLLLCGTTCWGQNNVVLDSAAPTAQPQTQIRNPGMSANGWQNELIRQKLDSPADFNYDEQPWREIEEQLEKHYGFNIVLTHSAQDDSLTDDEPMTENLTGIELTNALRLMLIKKNATYVIQDGVLKIVSLDDVEDAIYFSTSFINVRNLLARIAALEKSRIGQPRIVSDSVHRSLTPVVGQTDDKAAIAETKTDVTSTKQPVELVTAESMLLDLVRASIRSDEWKKSGQGLATIKIIGGIAVVNCNSEMADELRDFLADLSYHLSLD